MIGTLGLRHPAFRLVHILVLRELRTRYKVTVLGFLWSLLRPILLAAIFWVVGRLFLRFHSYYRVDYWVFLLAGLLPWTFLAGSLNDATHSYVDNAGLIRKVYFPRLVFPVVSVGSNLVNYLLGLVTIFGLLYLTGHVKPAPGLLLLPAVMAVHLLLVIGLSMILSVSNVYFRDTAMLLEFLLQAWFYFTPVFYPITLPLRFFQGRPLLGIVYPILNPMVSIIYGYRWALLGGMSFQAPPEAGDLADTWSAYREFHSRWPWFLLGSFILSCIILMFGFAIYRKNKGGIADEV